ncbi:hypothetical protein EDB19DRAFT_1758770, partial [Suillus lakei]
MGSSLCQHQCMSYISQKDINRIQNKRQCLPQLQDLVPQLQLGTTYGALFIGVTVAAVLFGLSNIQTFFYFQSHRDTGISLH